MRPFRKRLSQVAFPLYKRLETRLHPLRYLFLEVTQRCNLSCQHCGSDCGSERRPDELTTEEWLELLRKLKGWYSPKDLMLVVTGGEPLCHPDWGTLLQGFRSAGFHWGMVTNGWALSPRQLQACLQAGMVSATVSLDGLESSHDWLRGRRGSFARASRASELLGSSGIALFDVVTCVHPGNLRELPQVAAHLEGLGVPAWRLFSIFPRGRAKEEKGLHLNSSEFQEMLSFIEAYRRGEGKIDLQFSCEGYLPQSWDRKVRTQPYFCRAGISIASVLSDGAISACPNIPRALVQGNVREDDLDKVWNARFQAFRDRSWLKRGPCEGCDEWPSCQGNSLHLYDEGSGHTALCSYCLAGGD